jgi:hypothetical protein
MGFPSTLEVPRPHLGSLDDPGSLSNDSIFIHTICLVIWLRVCVRECHNARHSRFILSLDNHKMTFAKLQKVCKRL